MAGLPRRFFPPRLCSAVPQRAGLNHCTGFTPQAVKTARVASSTSRLVMYGRVSVGSSSSHSITRSLPVMSSAMVGKGVPGHNPLADRAVWGNHQQESSFFLFVQPPVNRQVDSPQVQTRQAGRVKSTTRQGWAGGWRDCAGGSRCGCRCCRWRNRRGGRGGGRAGSQIQPSVTRMASTRALMAFRIMKSRQHQVGAPFMDCFVCVSIPGSMDFQPGKFIQQGLSHLRVA